MTILFCFVTPIHHHRHLSSSSSTTLLLPRPLPSHPFSWAVPPSLHPHPMITTLDGHFWQPFDLPMSAEPETLQKYFSSSSSSSPRIRHVWRNMNANSFSQTSAYTKETWCARHGNRMAGWKLKKMLRVPHFWSSSLDSHSNLWLLSTWRRWTTYWWLWTFRGLSPCLAMHVFTKSLQRTKTGRKRLKSCTERW